MNKKEFFLKHINSLPEHVVGEEAQELALNAGIRWAFEQVGKCDTCAAIGRCEIKCAGIAWDPHRDLLK